MTKVQEINVKDTTIRTMKVGEADYICITDIARQKNTLEPNVVVGNWMRNRNTIEYLSIWENLNNPSFNPIEFEGFKQLQKMQQSLNRESKQTMKEELKTAEIFKCQINNNLYDLRSKFSTAK